MNNDHIDEIARLLGESPEDIVRDATKDERGSQLSNAVALDIVKIAQEELAKLGCRLKDYYIDFTTTGFDIKDFDIACDDPSRVIEVLKAADPSVRHEFSESPIKYAYMAANVEIARRVDEELGLDYQAFGFEDGDGVSVSVSEPKEEKSLPPEPDMLSPDIIDSVESLPEPDQTPDLGIEEPLELPSDDFEELPEYEEGESAEKTEEEPRERKPGREF